MYFDVRVTGYLDLAALDQSLRILVDPHETLRTTFDLRNGEPVQFIQRARPPIRALLELSGHRALAEDVYAVARREADAPFDLGK